MIHEIIAPISYRLIKNYRDKFIMPPVDKDEYFNDAIDNPDIAADIITNYINSESPCMISRWGFVELDAILNYQKGKPLSFLRNIYPFWVGKGTKYKMQMNAGFFPTSNKMLSRFSDYIISIASEIDVLTIFRPEEILAPNVHCLKIKAPYLEPFWSKTPWTKHLEGKKVLVVHPFAESITKQYERRNLIFENKDILPEFASLNVVKAVQSLGGASNGFRSWFEAFEFMEKQIDEIDYDVALIGCGAYGMPLAAHCKQKGKKAIHLGGVIQIMFGIKGSRWEIEQTIYKPFMNQYWVRPLDGERPPTADAVENACYW